jgi:surface polysaccharide O-acyltransferase-like enzyme
MKVAGSHIKSVDAMRVMAILAVVMIHTTTRTLEVVHYDLINYPWTIILNQLSRFAVPLFFLISGFVLELSSDRDTNYFEFLKKRFTKIFIPYIFWSLIYYFLVYTSSHDNLLRVILTGNASYQLYFIPTLCIFYVAFPLLHKIYKFIANPICLMLLGILQYRFLFLDYFVKHGGSDFPMRIISLSFFVFIIGMVGARNKDKVLDFAKKWKFFLSAGALYSGYFVFNEGRNLYYQIYNIGAIYSQYRPSVFAYTIFAGLALYAILDKVNMKKLSELSYFVFFIHVIVLEIIWKYFSKFVISNAVFDVAFFSVISIVSFLIAFLAHKIPHLNKITG